MPSVRVCVPRRSYNRPRINKRNYGLSYPMGKSLFFYRRAVSEAGRGRKQEASSQGVHEKASESEAIGFTSPVNIYISFVVDAISPISNHL